MTTDYENDPFAVVDSDIDWNLPAEEEITEDVQEEDKKGKKKKKKKEKKAKKEKKEKKPKEKLAVNGVLGLIAFGLIAAVIAIDVLFVAGNLLKSLLMLIPVIGQLVFILSSIMWVVRAIAFFAQALPILGALGLAITALIISLANKKLTPGQKKAGIVWAILTLVAALAYVLLSGIIKAVLFIVLLVPILIILIILSLVLGPIVAALSALFGMF